MKKKLLTLVTIIAFNSILNAQISDDKKFIELIQISKDYYFSDQNLKEFNLKTEFLKKINSTKTSDLKDFDSNFGMWLEKNLSKTTFGSVDEGISNYNLLNEITDLNDLTRTKISHNYKYLVEKYDLEEFMKNYNKAIIEINEKGFKNLDFDCEQKIAFNNFNTWAEYFNEVNQFEKESKTDFISKKFEANIDYGAQVYESCVEL